MYAFQMKKDFNTHRFMERNFTKKSFPLTTRGNTINWESHLMKLIRISHTYHFHSFEIRHFTDFCFFCLNTAVIMTWLSHTFLHMHG